ncbi:MAG: hypothetical protein Q9187_007632 [Circinaria calcarea]
MQTSSYLGSRCGEVVPRIFHELILVDRLRNLGEQDARRRLCLSTEVPVKVRVKDCYGNDEIVRGRADWAIGHEKDEADTGSLLFVVVGAKRSGERSVRLAQLMVCMTAVLESRGYRRSEGVFGMVADSGTFQFAFLDGTKKLFLSNLFKWSNQQFIILRYLDEILLELVGTAPYTGTRNMSLQGSPRSLKANWKFGEDEEEEGKEANEEMGGDGCMNAVTDQGVMAVRTKS